MKNVEEFLAHTIQLESEAALRFGQFADAMTTAGNKQVGKLFRRLADYSVLHLGDAKARAGFRTLPEIKDGDYRWPDIESPETAGLNFYADVLAHTDDPEIQVLAKEFVEEESQHVAELKRWIQLHLSGQPLPTEA